MKAFLWKLILPLSIISFTLVSKWWYVLPVDAPDTMMLGFPFPYVSDGWHTSMSLQIFIAESLVDLVFYYAIWFVLIYIINAFLFKVFIPKAVTVAIVCLATVCVVLLTFIASIPENGFYVKRNFDFEILETGSKFVWEGNPRPENFDFDSYARKKSEKPK